MEVMNNSINNQSKKPYERDHAMTNHIYKTIALCLIMSPLNAGWWFTPKKPLHYSEQPNCQRLMEDVKNMPYGDAKIYLDKIEKDLNGIVSVQNKNELKNIEDFKQCVKLLSGCAGYARYVEKMTPIFEHMDLNEIPHKDFLMAQKPTFSELKMSDEIAKQLFDSSNCQHLLKTCIMPDGSLDHSKLSSIHTDSYLLAVSAAPENIHAKALIIFACAESIKREYANKEAAIAADSYKGSSDKYLK